MIALDVLMIVGMAGAGMIMLGAAVPTLRYRGRLMIGGAMLVALFIAEVLLLIGGE